MFLKSVKLKLERINFIRCCKGSWVVIHMGGINRRFNDHTIPGVRQRFYGNICNENKDV